MYVFAFIFCMYVFGVCVYVCMCVLTEPSSFSSTLQRAQGAAPSSNLSTIKTIFRVE